MLTKSHITKIALEILQYRKMECWRQNNIAVKGRTFVGRKGVPDLIGWHKLTGIFMGCEVKASGDVLSQDQIDLLSALHTSGGIALIAHELNGAVVITDFKDYLVRELQKKIKTAK